MTPMQLRLIAQFLNNYSDQLGNNSCNDYELPNTYYYYAMLEEMERWNSSDPDQWQEPVVDGDKLLTQDWYIVRYLAHLCSEEATRLES